MEQPQRHCVYSRKLKIGSVSMIAIDITTALGSSIMAFILGMFIGVALGYIIWADRENQKRDTDESK